MRTARWILGPTLLAIALSGSAVASSAASEPAWGDIVIAGNLAASNQSLAMTSAGSTTYLHSVTTGLGPYQADYARGVRYRRTTNDGVRWTKAKQLAPDTHDVRGATIAAAGHHLYVAWVREKGTARIMYVRVNREHGNLAAWSDVTRMTPTDARIDQPSVAAIAGGDAIVAYTNMLSGTIRLRTTRDHGRTWAATTVGTTTSGAPGAYTGRPIVVATGQTVGLFWVADDEGTIMARVSTDAGRHWAAAVTVGSGAVPSASARAGRFAVASTQDGAPGWFRTWTDGAWSDPTEIAPSSLVPEGDQVVYGQPTVALGPSGAIGLLVTIEYPAGTEFPAPDAYLAWRASVDGGTTWTVDERVSNRYELVRDDGAAVAWADAAIHVQWTIVSLDYENGGTAAMLRTRR
jgi:hypothetical protein